MFNIFRAVAAGRMYDISYWPSIDEGTFNQDSIKKAHRKNKRAKAQRRKRK